MERQLSNQSDMMQMFMLSMIEGSKKRKRDDRSNEDSNNEMNSGKQMEHEEEKVVEDVEEDEWVNYGIC